MTALLSIDTSRPSSFEIEGSHIFPRNHQLCKNYVFLSEEEILEKNSIFFSKNFEKLFFFFGPKGQKFKNQRFLQNLEILFEEKEKILTEQLLQDDCKCDSYNNRLVERNIRQ